MKLIKAAQNDQLLKIKELYCIAFPREEQKEFSLILQKQEQGPEEILMIENDQKEFLGLAITISFDNMTLLDYFAIHPDYRGKGIGTEAFQLIKERYRHRNFILEIENPNIEAENKEQRIKRKSFYQKNGMRYVPFLVKIEGVEMEVLTAVPGLTYECYRKIYTGGYAPEIIRKLELLEIYRDEMVSQHTAFD